MLLARLGCRVLLVDRATFPSDAVSTHYLHLPAVAQLRDWGLLDRVLATGCPTIHHMTANIADSQLTGMPPEWQGVRFGIAPRRTLLDQILFNAAVDAGARACIGCTVDEIAMDGHRVTGVRGHRRGGGSFAATAPIVVGADGVHSLVARAVGAPEYRAAPPRTAVWYAYWQGTGIRDGLFARLHDPEIFIAPTNDDCVNVLVGCPATEFREFRKDIAGNYHRALARLPEIAERVRGGRQVGPFQGTRHTRQWMRRPYGPGWALVGDSGCHKDPVAGIGISDAFRHVHALVAAIHDGLSGRRPMSDALADFHTWRDATTLEHFEFVCDITAHHESPSEWPKLLEALQHNEAERSRFFGTFGAFVSPSEFFAPHNIERILTETVIPAS
jgi:2-polyprenyl-6-methoxyphenol hydroxylase-like FAD-dependent oxidoreductase